MPVSQVARLAWLPWEVVHSRERREDFNITECRACGCVPKMLGCKPSRLCHMLRFEVEGPQPEFLNLLHPKQLIAGELMQKQLRIQLSALKAM